jgi:HSP20 family protein
MLSHFFDSLFPDFRASVEICDQPQSPFVTATFELPGLKKEEIGVHLTHDGRLTISGDRRPPPFLTNTDATFVVYPVKEIKYGRFERTINVPPGLEVCPFTIALHCVESALTSHPGQGHKCVFGRWHAVCFLAAQRFSLCASSGTNTSHKHGIKHLRAAYGDCLSHQAPQPFPRPLCLSVSCAPLSSQIDTSSLRGCHELQKK